MRLVMSDEEEDYKPSSSSWSHKATHFLEETTNSNTELLYGLEEKPFGAPTTTTTTTNLPYAAMPSSPQAEEEETQSYTSCTDNMASFVNQPTDTDILCGQDKTFSQHPGNKLYRSVIAAWAEKYGHTSSKQSKMRMTTHICNLMKTHYKSRFLKPTPTLHGGKQASTSDMSFHWKELTDQAARDKISHALRTATTAARKRNERLQKQQTSRKQAEKKKQPQQQEQQQPEQQSPHDTWTNFSPDYHLPYCSYEVATSNSWSQSTHLSEFQDMEPVPVSTNNSFQFLPETNPLIFETEEEEQGVAQSLLERQQQIFRQLTERQESRRRSSSSTSSRSRGRKAAQAKSEDDESTDNNSKKINNFEWV